LPVGFALIGKNHLALEGVSGAEAAARLGMKVATVFVARSKVQKKIQDEVRRVEGADPVT
jgi:RNA polymerase sigma-70 factor (ECF subfamily)